MEVDANAIYKDVTTTTTTESQEVTTVEIRDLDWDDAKQTQVEEEEPETTTGVDIQIESDGVQTVNVIVSLDISGSMYKSQYGGVIDLPDGTETTRLQLAKDSLTNMINNYPEGTELNINFTAWDTGGTNYGWLTKDEALTLIEDLDGGSSTNYERGIYETHKALDDMPDADSTLSLFISDGEPTKNYGGTSDYLDQQYVDMWTDIVAVSNETKVVAMGEGIDDTSYLERMGEVSHVVDDTQLEDLAAVAAVEAVSEEYLYNNLEDSNFQLGDTDDTFIVNGEASNVTIDLGAGKNIVVLEQDPGGNVVLNGGNGKDLLRLSGDSDEYTLDLTSSATTINTTYSNSTETTLDNGDTLDYNLGGDATTATIRVDNYKDGHDDATIELIKDGVVVKTIDMDDHTSHTNSDQTFSLSSDTAFDQIRFTHEGGYNFEVEAVSANITKDGPLAFSGTVKTTDGHVITLSDFDGIVFKNEVEGDIDDLVIINTTTQDVTITTTTTDQVLDTASMDAAGIYERDGQYYTMETQTVPYEDPALRAALDSAQSDYNDALSAANAAQSAADAAATAATAARAAADAALATATAKRAEADAAQGTATAEQAQADAAQATATAEQAQADAAQGTATAERAEADLAQAAADAEHAQADAAQAAADTAQGEADAAQAAADAATTEATSAQAAADAAQAAADAAQATADAEQAEADTAQATAATERAEADAAQSTADSSQASADAAQTTASTERAEADAAQATADAEQAEADTAQATASAERAEADAAQTTADAEQSEADIAQAVATTERAEADAAQATADAEQTEADTAQAIAVAERAEADAAQIEVNAAQHDLEGAQSTLSDAQAALNSAIADADNTDDLSALQDAVAAAQADVESAEAVLNEAEGVLESAQASADEAQALADAEQAEADAAQAIASEERAEADEAQSQADAAQDSADEAQVSADELSDQAEQAQNEADVARDVADSAREQADQLQSVLDLGEGDLEQLQSDLSDAQASADILETQAQELEAKVEELRAQLEAEQQGDEVLSKAEVGDEGETDENPGDETLDILFTWAETEKGDENDWTETLVEGGNENDGLSEQSWTDTVDSEEGTEEVKTLEEMEQDAEVSEFPTVDLELQDDPEPVI